MIFLPLKISDVVLIRSEPISDNRGFFVRTFCSEEFSLHRLPTVFVQCNLSFNEKRGTLRGLHWQDEPYLDGKLVRCTKGSIFDVAVDIRPGSVTRGNWVAAVLSEQNGESLFIPEGFAHGFQTLTDHSEVFYQMSRLYQKGMSRGIKWNDPILRIDWPISDPILSERDANLPHFTQ